MGKKTVFRCVLLTMALLLGHASFAQSFKKGYKRYYQKQNFAAADAVFARYRDHARYAPAARYFLAKNRLRTERSLPALMNLNEDLYAGDSLLRRLSPRRARRLLRKYGVDTTAITTLRAETQRWAMAGVRARGSIAALDSLLEGWSFPLPSLQPEMDRTRKEIVNNQLLSRDYDIMTAIVRRYLSDVQPANYALARQLYEGLWTAFQEKYPLCELDVFTKDHAQTFVARDCWKEAVRTLLCDGTLQQLIDFQATNKWTALENLLINNISAGAAQEAVLTLTAAQTNVLEDLKQRAAFRERLRTGQAARDTSAAVADALRYISKYAPRYSAYRLLEESLQFFLEEEFYGSAIELLHSAEPYFPDTLPDFCRSNFDFQKRVKPYIKGILPILQKQDADVRQAPVAALCTEAGDEFSPVLNAGQTELYFAASGRPDNLEGVDVFRSLRQQDRWTSPVLVPALSGPGQQIPLSLTGDGQTMLLLIDGKLYLSKRGSDTWQSPSELVLTGLPLISKAVLSTDGNVLLLEGSYSAGTVLNAPDMDIFVSGRLKNGQWSEPKALGSDINTEGTEGNPYLSQDGKSLYFTSTGYPGLGKSDVFMAQRTGPDWVLDWSQPMNLGKKINDIFHHRGFCHVSADGRQVYFARYGRDWEKGDIWMLEIKSE